jgi:nicotinate-nucleotide adenylyltransferase
MNRLGLLGGTFDPPHIGHLLLAECARDQLALDSVLFLPAGRPPHKEGDTITAVHHRLAMTRLATDGHESFLVDTGDVERPAPHYTVTLLPLIRERYPQATLWLLLGGDSLRDLPTWHRPDELSRWCRLAVLPRPGDAVDRPALKRQLPATATVVDLLDGPLVAVSGRQIRRWAAMGRSLRYLTVASVIEYIQREKLYHWE